MVFRYAALTRNSAETGHLGTRRGLAKWNKVSGEYHTAGRYTALCLTCCTAPPSVGPATAKPQRKARGRRPRGQTGATLH